MATELSNHYLYQVMTKQIDWANDAFFCMLMNTSFAFNKDTHSTLDDVFPNEISNTGGYAREDLIVTAVTENDTDDSCDVTVNDVLWTPPTGDFDDTVGMIIIDDTSTDNTVVGFIDFGVTESILHLITFPVDDIDIRLGG